MKYILLVALLITVSCDNAQAVWDNLTRFYTKEGTAAIMGNLDAESGLESVIYESAFKPILGLSFQQYVDKVNSGEYTESQFVNDKIGFGIAQWSYYSKKKELYTLCKGKIGDLTCQLDYLVKELRVDFSKLNNYLTDTTNLREASNRVLDEYSRPVVPNYSRRYQLSLKHYEKFK